MLSLGDRLKKQRQNAGLTQQQVADIIGKSKGNISGYEKGSFEPSASTIIELAKCFNISTDYILLGEMKAELSIEQKELLNTFDKLDFRGRAIVSATAYHELDRMEGRMVKAQSKVIPFERIQHQEELAYRSIPLFDLPASAGTGVFLDSGSYELIDIPVSPVTIRASFAVQVCGDSMEPDFEDGEIVLVKQQPDLENGEVGNFIFGGDGYIKKIDKNTKPWKLISLNPNYGSIDIKRTDDFRIAGKVIGKFEG